jgi:DNA-binding MarR family transcriptional regulator
MVKREAPFLGARLHHAHQDYTAAFMAKFGKASGDITPTQLHVMWAASEADQPSQTDLVAATGIDRSTLADVVRRLVKQGRLARTRKQHDTRAYAVTLTAEGFKELEKCRRIVARLDAEIGTEILQPLRRV